MKKIFFIGFLMLTVCCLKAQTFETGGIVGAEYDMKIMKGWHWGAETEVRFNQNFTHYGRWKIGAGTDYSFWKKRMKLAVGYSFMNCQDERGKFDFRHRVTGSLTFAQKLGRCKLSYRAAFQTTFRDARRGDYTFNPKTYMRNRLVFSYACPNKPLKIYASEEFWWRLYHPEKNIIDELRTTVGVEYQVRKHHTLDFFLRSSNEVQVSNPANVLYLGVKYSFD